MTTVLVLFGGASNEHEVSLLSAKSVIENIPREDFRVEMLGITKQGGWLHYSGDPALLPDGKWLEDSANLTPAVLSPDPAHGGLLLLKDGETQTLPVDVVFPVLHGKNGEDGTIQGLLTLAQLPFVGCDLLSSAMCMDKGVTNLVMDFAGIAQAKWRAFTQSEFASDGEALLAEAAAYLDFPLFVKPANAGSSVGVSKVKAANALRAAVESAFLHDGKVVLEEGIDGSELECAVLGDARALCSSVVGEIAPSNEFYDYSAKYIDNESGLYIPARVSEADAEALRAIAAKAYCAMGCAGLARVDFFRRHSDGALLLNELNTLPGFTAISMYPKLFAAAGLPYPELLRRLISLALNR